MSTFNIKEATNSRVSAKKAASVLQQAEVNLAAKNMSSTIGNGFLKSLALTILLQEDEINNLKWAERLTRGDGLI